VDAIKEFVLDRPGRRAMMALGAPAASPFRTILFTDVVSSTPLLTQLRDQRMREVMRDHDAVMEAAVTGHGGRVVKTIGDAFMAEFAVPSAAVEAAIEAQRQIREKFAASDVPVRLRIGINAGEPIEEAGDLHGASVVIAKRLESAAETNGILVSDVVKQMVTGKDFDFEDRGLVELKGFEEPVRAWTVRWE
jgi:class 3 adenylate cyclase